MSKNSVIWKEGLFVQPQHFQQQQRHIDYLIQNQLLGLNNNYKIYNDYNSWLKGI